MISRFAALCALWAGAAMANPTEQVLSAQYTEPTTRYAHGILGDAIEWGALEMTVDRCFGCENADLRTVTVTLPDTAVFEDVAPRLVDIDADDRFEVMVVESRLDAGARLAIYQADGSVLAATPYIGRRNRWLAPIGAADLDGDGFVEVAYIDRPHLAKTLRVWRYVAPDLVPVGDLPGLTNHRIGEPDIGGGLRICGDVVEMITADANWQRVIATRFTGSGFETRDMGLHRGRASLEAAMTCSR